MAELTPEATSPNRLFGTKSSPCCKSEPEKSAATSLQNLACQNNLIYVRYLDHVMFNRSSASFMKPQVREAVGWLVYECEEYVTLSWDRDADPPTLRGGDLKASGLVLLKSDILALKRLGALPLKENLECLLNSEDALVKKRVGASRQGSEKLKKLERIK